MTVDATEVNVDKTSKNSSVLVKDLLPCIIDELERFSDLATCYDDV